MGRGVERADGGEVVVSDEAVPAGGAVQCLVVDDNRLAIAAELEVDLAGGGPRRLGLIEGEQGIFRIMQAIAPVRADVGVAVVRGAERDRHFLTFRDD